MRRAVTWTCQAVVVLLFAAAFWLRASSLESLPEPNGDEAWHGTQAYHIAHGEPVYLQTGNGNPLNPLNTGLMSLLLKFSEPRLWVLRTPALICGVLAVILAYFLSVRVLDKTTALLASAFLAVLPAAICYSRRGWDCSPTPLFGVLLLVASYRAKWKEMLLAFVGGLLCHPTNVFMLPVVLPIYLARTQPAFLTDPRRRKQVAIGVVVVLGLFFVAGMAFMNRPQVRLLQIHGFEGGRPRWGVALRLNSREALLYLRRLPILFLGEPGASKSATSVQNWAFWTVLLGTFVTGTVRLVRERCWDRLALVAGLGAGASSLFLIAGAAGLRPVTNRYGLFLVAPLAFACAVLVRALVVEPSSPGRRIVRSVQVAGLLAVGWGLLLCYQHNFVDLFQGNARAESLWTLRTDVEDPRYGALRVVIRDSRLEGPARAGQKTVIVAYDWWTRWPLTYLTANLGFVDVHQLIGPIAPGPDKPALRRFLEEGAYAVCFRGQDLEKAVAELFPADRIQRWEVARPGNVAPPPNAGHLMRYCTSVVVYRLKPPSAELAQAPLRAAGANNVGRW
ncbi:MAG: glycosyltransferase family 39 protein [Isosphaeraceae bacterium]|nr:glycosyltransferase family 39 protein [Isosphaeraceae bacterium]